MTTITPDGATPMPPQQPATRTAHDWRAAYGPNLLRMPNDGTRGRLTGPYPRVREDSEDALFADGTAEAPGAARPGGSGIELGHSVYEPENLRDFAEGVKRRPPVAVGAGLNGFDWEHLIRGTRDAGALAEQTGERADIQAFLALAQQVYAIYGAGTTHSGADWAPFTLAQHQMMVHQHPHTGYPANIRAVAWVEYILAWSCKWSPLAIQHCKDFLDLTELSYIPGSAQQGCGGIQGVPQQDVQQTFWWGLFAHATIACATQTQRSVPHWVLTGMLQHASLHSYDYYGEDSLPKYTRTVNAMLMPADDAPGQGGDPAFGFWSSNCVAIAKATGDSGALRMATRWGPLSAVDEESRKLSMLYRGATS